MFLLIVQESDQKEKENFVHWSNWKDLYFLIPDNYRPTPIPNIDFLFRSDYSTYSYTCITGLAMSEILVLCGFFMIYIVEEVTHVMVDKLHRGMKRRVTDVSNWIEKDSTVRARNFRNSAKKPLFAPKGYVRWAVE